MARWAVRFDDRDEVLEKLGEAGINRERMMSVDSSKIDEALDVVKVAKSEVYDIDESEYVRKADVNDKQKETRLQGLKDQLAAAEMRKSRNSRKRSTS